MLALAERAQAPTEMEQALVALAEYEADHPDDAVVHEARQRLAAQFAAGVEPIDHEMTIEAKRHLWFGINSSG